MDRKFEESFIKLLQMDVVKPLLKYFQRSSVHHLLRWSKIKPKQNNWLKLTFSTQFFGTTSGWRDFTYWKIARMLSVFLVGSTDALEALSCSLAFYSLLIDKRLLWEKVVFLFFLTCKSTSYSDSVQFRRNKLKIVDDYLKMKLISRLPFHKKKIQLQYDNSRPHTSQATQEAFGSQQHSLFAIDDIWHISAKLMGYLCDHLFD